MKKNIKLVLALIVAMMMIISSISALAADTVGVGKINNHLTVSGLDTGDKVTVYQILQWGPDQDTPVDGIKDGSNYVLVDGVPTGWIWGDGVDDSALTNADLLNIIGKGTAATQGITGELASKIASHLSSTKKVDEADLTGADSWEGDVTEAGLYMVIVTPASADTIYNPIFVAANYYTDKSGADSSNSIAVSENEMTYADSAMAKKSTIPLSKEAAQIGTDTDSNNSTTDTVALAVDDDNPTTGDVGEIYEFKVTSTIPKFAANYTNPVFKLKDTMTTGLKLDESSIQVFYFDSDTNAWVAWTETGHYVVSDKDAQHWTITFDKDYIKSAAMPADGLKVKVTYLAEVTSDAEKIINQDSNDVDLIFSTTPDDEEGHGVLRRETNHFTFSIDAGMFGSKDWTKSSNEAVKVGVDKDGNPIVSTSTEYWGGTTHAPLEDAEFELQYPDGTVVKNDLYPNGITGIKSDASGRITIKGLDQGNYKLVETKAPAGYIKLQDAIDVNITAVIKTSSFTETVKNGAGEDEEVTYETNYVESYTVTVGGSTTTYNIELSANATDIEEVKRSVSSSDSELKNTKGIELPSTGGIGTTIFYVGGSLMVLAAAILLITKRRMGVED